MTLQQTTSARRQSLEAAFNLFNQLSQELTGSYSQLQMQVMQLSQELAAARSERMLQLAEKERLADRLERLLETLPAAVVVLTGNDRVKEFNPAAAKLFGALAANAYWPELEAKIAFPHPHASDELHLRNGRLLSVSCSRLEQAPGRILVMLDVTETRRLQERLNRQERLGAMGEMSAQLAHQMRTPLSTALLYVSHLANDRLSPDQRQTFTAKLKGRLQHMEHQIRDILMFARGSTDGEELISLVELVQKFVNNLSSELQRTGISLQLQVEGTQGAKILGRSDALLGVLGNLTDNAIQQGANQIDINLTFTRDEQVKLRYADNGPGVPMEYREKIFDPFFTTRSGGTGLGLAVVQNIILSHRGVIQLLSTGDDTGAVFEMLFPAVVEDYHPTGVNFLDRSSQPTQYQVRSLS